MAGCGDDSGTYGYDQRGLSRKHRSSPKIQSASSTLPYRSVAAYHDKYFEAYNDSASISSATNLDGVNSPSGEMAAVEDARKPTCLCCGPTASKCDESEAAPGPYRHATPSERARAQLAEIQRRQDIQPPTSPAKPLQRGIWSRPRGAQKAQAQMLLKMQEMREGVGSVAARGITSRPVRIRDATPSPHTRTSARPASGSQRPRSVSPSYGSMAASSHPFSTLGEPNRWRTSYPATSPRLPGGHDPGSCSCSATLATPTSPQQPATSRSLSSFTRPADAMEPPSLESSSSRPTPKAVKSNAQLPNETSAINLSEPPVISAWALAAAGASGKTAPTAPVLTAPTTAHSPVLPVLAPKKRVSARRVSRRHKHLMQHNPALAQVFQPNIVPHGPDRTTGEIRPRRDSAVAVYADMPSLSNTSSLIRFSGDEKKQKSSASNSSTSPSDQKSECESVSSSSSSTRRILVSPLQYVRSFSEHDRVSSVSNDGRRSAAVDKSLATNASSMSSRSQMRLPLTSVKLKPEMKSDVSTPLTKLSVGPVRETSLSLRKSNSPRTVAVAARFAKGVALEVIVKGPNGVRHMRNFKLQILETGGKLRVELSKQQRTKVYCAEELEMVDCNPSTCLGHIQNHMSPQAFDACKTYAARTVVCIFDNHSLPLVFIFESLEDKSDFVELLAILVKKNRPDDHRNVKWVLHTNNGSGADSGGVTEAAVTSHA